MVDSLWSSAQYGTTPLIWAARKGHFDSVMHLLANGADVDQEGAVRYSPSAIMWSVRSLLLVQSVLTHLYFWHL